MAFSRGLAGRQGRHKTRLEKKRISRVYRRRLRDCWATCEAWLAAKGITWPRLIERSASEIDRLLVSFVNHAHDVGTEFYIAKHCVLFVQWQERELVGALPRTWDALKAWNLTRPWQSRIPISEDLTHMLFLAGLELGITATSREEGFNAFIVGLLMWTAFAGLLRPGEMMHLRPCDIKFVRRIGAPLVVLLAIRDPKTRSHMGRAQFALIKDSRVGHWLHWLVGSSLTSTKPIWRSSQHHFRALLRDMLEAIHLDDIGFTPGSARAGGATHRYIEGDTIERLQYQGRWKALSSLKSYIQEAVSSLIWAHVNEAVESEIQTNLLAFAHVVAEPPSDPLQSFFPDGEAAYRRRGGRLHRRR